MTRPSSAPAIAAELRNLRSGPDQLPPRLLPVLYFTLAHASLAIAFLAVGLSPRAVAGFFYHSRMVAIVHLITLGWITSSILGALYLAGPIALRAPMPARRLDYWACGSTAIGVIGMVVHFWIAEFSGMAWSALMVTAGILWVGWRTITAVSGAPIQRVVKLHIILAFANVGGAATMGVLLGFDKVYHFLPGFVLTNVYAHAHLAAVGWVSMMAIGVGYRLLPMILPAAMPSGRSVYASAVLLELGAAGLFVGLLTGTIATQIGAILVVLGFAAFIAQVIWMRRHPRPAPVGLARPDYGARHVACALAYLAVTCALGLFLAFAPASDWTLRAALVYGVCGLIGFLAQLIVGVSSRLLPMSAWYWEFANGGGDVTSPHDMPVRTFQQYGFYFWFAGIPLLAGGFFFTAVPFLAAGAWLLLAAVVFNTANTIVVLRHAFVRPQACRRSPGAAGRVA